MEVNHEHEHDLIHLLAALVPSWSGCQGYSKRDWKYRPISIYFHTERDTGGKAHRVFICNHCVASRSDAGGICCRGLPHLLGFSSLLRPFHDWFFPWGLSSHPLTLPSWLQQHFPEKNNEMGEQSSWASLWKLFGHAPRFKSYLGIQFSLILVLISRIIAQRKFNTLNYTMHCVF